MNAALYRSFLLLFLFFGRTLLYSQNLVLNPSFENYTSCPVGPGELTNAPNWTNPFANVLTTCSTSDLYNICALVSVGVPASILGTEPARTGDGYAGIILSEGFALMGCSTYTGTNWREYVQGRLSSPLQAGESYCVTFYISLGDNVGYATDDIGVFFSNSQLAVSCGAGPGGFGPLTVTPQLVWNGGMLNNSNGWTQLQWTYTATGGEQFFTIGNFLGDANTTINCLGGPILNPFAYYFIDDVSVEPGNCGILAVTLSEFQGEAESDGNRIWWESTYEREVDHYAIEKSGDGEQWEPWQEVEAYNLERGSFYEILDPFPGSDHLVPTLGADAKRRPANLGEHPGTPGGAAGPHFQPHGPESQSWRGPFHIPRLGGTDHGGSVELPGAIGPPLRNHYQKGGRGTPPTIARLGTRPLPGPLPGGTAARVAELDGAVDPIF